MLAKLGHDCAELKMELAEVSVSLQLVAELLVSQLLRVLFLDHLLACILVILVILFRWL